MEKQFNEMMAWAFGKDWRSLVIEKSEDSFHHLHPTLPKLERLRSGTERKKTAYLIFQINKLHAIWGQQQEVSNDAKEGKKQPTYIRKLWAKLLRKPA